MHSHSSHHHELFDVEPDYSLTVYDLALQALFDARKHTSVAIHLDFRSTDGNFLRWLSLSSAYWPECSLQVRSLSFLGYIDTEKHKTLLQSTPYLKHLTFDSCGALNLKELTQYIEPGLHSFELDGAFCLGSELSFFFNRHQNSMARVKMSDVSISEDNWPELEQLMREMPNRKEVDLFNLGVHSGF